MIRDFLVENIDYVVLIYVVVALATSLLVGGYRIDFEKARKGEIDPRDIAGTLLLYGILSPILPVWWAVKAFFKLWKSGGI